MDYLKFILSDQEEKSFVYKGLKAYCVSIPTWNQIARPQSFESSLQASL